MKENILGLAGILIGNLLQIFIFLNGVFYLFISLCSVLMLKKTGEKSRGSGKKFAILVPAHNEESVIAYFLESAVKTNYPAELRDIYVISDHSSDGTLEIAKRYPVSVFDFSEKDKRPGKAAALNRAASLILQKNYDALCYFDADSLVHPEFLNYMCGHLNAGRKVIQGRQVSKNPKEGWLARILSVGQIISNRFFQKPKSLLGFSATFHGKGICLSREIAAEHPWDEDCLTEDLELQMRLIRNGIKIHWGEHAVVYDEQPLNLKQYFKRTIRWTRGSLDTARKHLKGLIAAFLKTGDPKILEAALYCANVYRLSLIGLTAIFIYFRLDGFNFLVWLYHLIPGSELLFKLLFFSPLFFVPFIILVIDRVEPDLLLAYFLQPVLGLLRIPTFVAGVFKNRINWDRTDHGSRVAISDLVNPVREKGRFAVTAGGSGPQAGTPDFTPNRSRGLL
ncbi:MAG: hypothetical protein COT17_02580 [Elusimicrobia bacterium CG08_land_8_20_14_0_20_51_18]|nr:MAG: hypothetical protein COT17_02580 [Elusimicrobia bacterium CG08_land_8_20_14_0_20_51_18]